MWAKIEKSMMITNQYNAHEKLQLFRVAANLFQAFMTYCFASGSNSSTREFIQKRL